MTAKNEKNRNNSNTNKKTSKPNSKSKFETVKKQNSNTTNKSVKQKNNFNNSKKNKENKPKNINIQEIEKVVNQELKSKKIILKQEQKRMNEEVFKNIFIAIAFVVLFNCIILGFINIKQSIFIVDLKVFAIMLLATAIGTFEYAYKNDSGKVAIYGIETLIVSICILVFIYLDIMFNSKFVVLAILFTYIIAIYYTVKSIIVYQKMKKQYFINSMKEIIKK